MAKKKPQSRPPTKVPKAELLPKGYEAFLGELKERIRTVRPSMAGTKIRIMPRRRAGSSVGANIS